MLGGRCGVRYATRKPPSPSSWSDIVSLEIRSDVLWAVYVFYGFNFLFGIGMPVAAKKKPAGMAKKKPAGMAKKKPAGMAKKKLTGAARTERMLNLDKKMRERIAKHYSQWLERQYIKTTIPSKIIAEWGGQFRAKYSSVARTNAFRIRVDVAMARPVDTLVTTFKVHQLNTGKDVTFGILYSVVANSMPNMTIKEKNISHTRYTATPSLASCDGEYRRNLNNMRSFLTVKSKFPEIWDAIEFILVDKVNDNNWALTSDVYYPTNFSRRLSIVMSYSINKHRFAENILAVAWFLTTYQHMNKTHDMHINPMYKEIMLSDISGDIRAMRNMIDKFGVEKISVVAQWLSKINHIPHAGNPQMEVGQKIIPLGLAEAQNPFDIRYKPWREMLIANRVAGLVLNGTACGFSMPIGWVYIKNQKKGLFDNKIQYERMEKGEIAAAIAGQLAVARRSARVNAEESKSLSKSFLSMKFRNLYDHIKEPIDYCKDELIMSEVALGISSEYVGNTFLSTAVICRRSAVYHKLMGMPFAATGLSMFKRYIFELCYNLLCMNKHAGVIHGDLHLNNITFRKKIAGANHKFEDLKNPKILFVVGKVQFLLPTRDYNTCIIDFSRSTVHRNRVDETHIAYMGKNAIDEDGKRLLDKESRARLLGAFLQMFPDMIDRKANLAALFISHYDAVYKFMTLVDIHNVVSKILSMFKRDKMFVSGTPAHSKFLQSIKKMASTMLRTQISQLMTDYRHEAAILDDVYPMETIIKKIFTEFVVAGASDVDLTDVFVCDNPNKKYSFDEESTLPPYVTHISKGSSDPTVRECSKLPTNFGPASQHHPPNTWQLP